MYDLTKKEYNEYQGKFIRTWIGAKLFVECIILAVVWALTTVEFLTMDYVGPVTYVILAMSIITGIGALMYDAFYMREFHMFIREQLKDGSKKKKEK